jgi:hypothetical protein
MNRRRFFKYAGATAAVVGASAVGFDLLPKPQSSSTTSATSSTSATSLTSASTLVSSAKQLATLRGKLFFDYNGNGKQDDNEPSIVDAKVQLKNDFGNVVADATADSSGAFKIEDLPIGDYTLFPVADPKFRYMCRSVEEFTSVTHGYFMSLPEGLPLLNIGLMEGFLTLAFPKGIPIYVDSIQGDYFFHGNAPPKLWWNGTKPPGPSNHSPKNANPATDFYMPEGTEVKAAVAGTINGIKTESNGVQWISLTHPNGFGTTYLHIKKATVPVGAQVNRGDTIALSGHTGAGEDNYHTAFQLWRHMPDGNYYCIDPYSPVVGVPKGAWIAGTWQWYPSDEEWISQGYWTKLNDPQYPPT